MPKVACCSLNAETGPHIEIFEKAGFDVVHADRSVDLFTEAGLIDQLQGAEASVAGSEPYTRAVIEACPDLRVIARSGVGWDAVDTDACDEHGIVVTTTPGVNHHAVAEHAMAFLMGIARGFPAADQQVRVGVWTRKARPRVMGSTIGILGLGRIGQAVATRAIGLGMNVVAYDPYPNDEFIQQWKIEMASLDDVIERADYLSLHLPSTPETHHLINADSLGRMKAGSVLINTARGPLVDETALYDALKSGHIRGAGLDVFEVEPLSTDSPLLEFDNVYLSGHVAGLDCESHNDTFTMLASTTIELHNGGWPDYCIQNLKGVTDWKWARD